MTVLSAFTKLESSGLWRAAPNQQRRDVIVALGDATLVICDSVGRPLAHWSLPAVRRINTGQIPALFAPEIDAAETLEINDDTMIAAIETVARAVNRRRNKQGRLRSAGFVALLLCLISLGVFWLPNALIREAQSVVPAVKRAEIGAAVLGHMHPVTGPICGAPLGRAALSKLHLRALGPDAGGQVVVVPSGPDWAIVLPGGLILMAHNLIEKADNPAVVAGHIIAAAAQARAVDPLARLLQDRGLGTTLSLLTTGDIQDDTLRLYAEDVFSARPPRASDLTLLDMFAFAQIPSTPFAGARDEANEGLIDADPMRSSPVPEILSDADWTSLKAICD